MDTVIGELLPLAVGVAVSPVPIIAVILMLLSPQAHRTGLGFLLGWVGGIAVATALCTALSAVLPRSGGDTGSSPVAAVIKILAGAVLVGLAIRQWRSRPDQGETAPLPKWMSAIDSLSVIRAIALGAALAAVNPKNLLMSVSAGLAIGAAQVGVAGSVVAIVVFTVLAGSTVLVPVLGYLAAGRRMGPALERLRSWLVANNAAIMAVLLLVIGAVVIGHGIGSF